MFQNGDVDYLVATDAVGMGSISTSITSPSPPTASMTAISSAA